MITIVSEISLEDFEAWNGAEDNLAKIIEADKISEVEDLLKEQYPGGATDDEVNDFLMDYDGTLGYEFDIDFDEDNLETDDDKDDSIKMVIRTSNIFG